MADTVVERMAPVSPTRTMARVLNDVPEGAEIHGVAVVVVYAGETGGKPCAKTVALQDAISTLGSFALAEQMTALAECAYEKADSPPWTGH